MSAVESALDVLSRAATMMQEERSKVTNLHRKPSSAWRKDRRRDPIQSEALDMSRTNHHHNRPSVIVPPTTQVGITIEDSTMTSTTTSTTASGGQRTIIRTTGGVYVSDPAIDEHFKRSLGPKKYAAVFNATTTDKETGLSGKYRQILNICPVKGKIDATFWIQHGPALDNIFHGPSWTNLDPVLS